MHDDTRTVVNLKGRVITAARQRALWYLALIAISVASAIFFRDRSLFMLGLSCTTIGFLIGRLVSVVDSAVLDEIAELTLEERRVVINEQHKRLQEQEEPANGDSDPS